MFTMDFAFIPPIIAHRGASALAPENTLSAFLKAKEAGVQWVEFDVMLAACGEVVVIHDDRLDRTTTGQGNVCDFTYATLKKLDAGSWFDPHFAEERISRLQEVLAFLHAHQMRANIEIKPSPGTEALTVKQVLKVLEMQRLPGMQPFLLSSFSFDVLREIRQYGAHYQLGFLMDEWVDEWQMLCDELHCVTVNVNQMLLNAERIQAIHATHRQVLAYTVNDIHRASELFSWGIDAIFSDDPQALLNFGMVDLCRV